MSVHADLNEKEPGVMLVAPENTATSTSAAALNSTASVSTTQKKLTRTGGKFPRRKRGVILGAPGAASTSTTFVSTTRRRWKRKGENFSRGKPRDTLGSPVATPLSSTSAVSTRRKWKLKGEKIPRAVIKRQYYREVARCDARVKACDQAYERALTHRAAVERKRQLLLDFKVMLDLKISNCINFASS